MTQKMHQQHKYISKYSNHKVVSAAQYITELICERKANKEKKDLHYRFWLSKEWAVFFKNQIATAHKLLKNYQDKAIINALLSDKGKLIYSLRAPHLPPMIEEAQTLLNNANQNFTKQIERKDNIMFGHMDQNTKKGIVSKLRDIE